MKKGKGHDTGLSRVPSFDQMTIPKWYKQRVESLSTENNNRTFDNKVLQTKNNNDKNNNKMSQKPKDKEVEPVSRYKTHFIRD